MWRRWFAWHPVRTTGGHLVWCRMVERRWDNNLNPWLYYGYSGTDGGFEFRLPLI